MCYFLYKLVWEIDYTMNHWKEASSLILASRGSSKRLASKAAENVENQASFNILAMKRSSKSSFFPNAVVFPGGVTEKHDFSPRWYDVFKKSGINDTLVDGFKLPDAKKPPMYLKNSFTSITGGLAPDISFRINAIRETFEETGILIAKRNSGSTEDELPSFKMLSDWRKRVAKDASIFPDLFLEFDLFPNVFLLKEWCNWLTPVTEQTLKDYRLKKRYDTMFYIACIDHQPESSNDEDEAESITWITPTESLQKFHSSEIILGPPQIYEFGRLANFSSMDDIIEYINLRNGNGVERWCPVNYRCKDGLLCTLPGDDSYPKNPNIVDGELIKFEESLLENRNNARNLNRMEIKSQSDILCFCNVKLEYDQIAPAKISF